MSHCEEMLERMRYAIIKAAEQPPVRPELFRPVEHPLGLCPFPLTTVALACMPCPQEPC